MEFSGDGGESPPDKPNKKAECLKKEVNGQNICVERKVETFQVQGLENKFVNFIFVLDVSPSMTDDLARLGQAFEPLISQIKGINWQMFFTTADHGDHTLITEIIYYGENPSMGEHIVQHQKWQDYQGDQPYFGRLMYLEYQGKKQSQKQLNAKTPDYTNVFKDTLTRGLDEDCSLAPYCQGSMEQPLRALNSSLEQLAQNGSLATGDIVSFIITDEDERVEDQAHATTAEEVLQNFKKLFPEKSFHAFSLLIQDEECLAQQRKHSPQSVYGKKISKLAEMTQGKNISLCESNYGPPLEELSVLLRGLIESLKLKEEPILNGEITVEFVKGKNRPGWELQKNNLVFKEALEPGSEIKVSYFVKAK